MYSIDTSAWHRRANPLVQLRFVELVDADQIAVCDQARLEILYSARNPADYDRLLLRLSSLHVTPTTQAAWVRAIQVQQALSRAGGLHHRSVKIADLVIAAACELADQVVLHYDQDFDRIAEVTGQPTEWIAPRGSA